MQWQDIVFSIGSVIFFLALVPTIRAKEKPAFSTSLITGIVLLVFSLSYATLSLWLTAGLNTITATCWLILALQKHRQIKKK